MLTPSSPQKKSRSLCTEISCRRNYFKRKLMKAIWQIEATKTIRYTDNNGACANIFSKEEQNELAKVQNQIEVFLKKMTEHRFIAYKEASDQYDAEVKLYKPNFTQGTIGVPQPNPIKTKGAFSSLF